MTTCDGCGQEFDLDTLPSVVHEPDCPWPYLPAEKRQVLCPCPGRGADAGKGADGDKAWCCEGCRLMTTGDYMNTPIGVVAIADVWSWFAPPEEA